MVDKRKIRFEYFKVVTSADGLSFNYKYDFAPWIESVKGLALEARSREYYDEQARLDKIEYRDEKDYYFLTFSRLRETNIPRRAYTNKESEDIELQDGEYIGEEVAAIYDKSSGLLMLQANRFSLSYKGIEKYLNMTKTVSTDPDIHLLPVPRHIDINYVNSSKHKYKKVSVKFADTQLTDEELRESGLGEYIELRNQSGSNTLEVFWGMGRTRGELSSSWVRGFVSKLFANKNLINKVKMDILKEDGSREEVDLFSENTFQDVIEFTIEKKTTLSSKSQYVEDSMFKRFEEKKGVMSQAIRKD